VTEQNNEDQSRRHGEGSDVGGPSEAIESSKEKDLVDDETDDDDQTLNPA